MKPEKNLEQDIKSPAKLKENSQKEEASVNRTGTIAEGAGLDTMRDVNVSYAEKNGSPEPNSVAVETGAATKPSLGKFTDMINKEATQEKGAGTSMQRIK